MKSTFLAVVLVLTAFSPLLSQAQTDDLASLRTKAEAGDPASELALGRRYWAGNGVPRDQHVGLDWIRKAAEAGNSGAQNFLAGQLCCGIGPIDHAQAAYWFEKAAEQGVPGAQVRIAEAYQKGDGVPQSTDKAIYWYQKAADQGVDSARQTLSDLSARSNSQFQPVDTTTPTALEQSANNQHSAIQQQGKINTVDTKTDFTNISAGQVLALLKTPRNIKITGAERSRDKRWFKMCESDGSECSSLATSDDLSLAIRLTLIGCSYEAIQGHQAMSNCIELAKYLFMVGNIDAARAVIEHAPGCHGFNAANDPDDQCFNGLNMIIELRNRMSPEEIWLLAKDAYSYDPGDVDAAQYLNDHGANLNIEAAVNARHEASVSNNTAVNDNNQAIDRAEAANDARRDALLGTLHNMAGSNDPNAIVNAGNQQAAAIRHIGNAQANQPSVATTPATSAAMAQPFQGTTAPPAMDGPNYPGAVTSEQCPNMQVYPDAGASCNPVRGENSCVRIVSNTWNPPSATGGAGQLRVVYENICNFKVRLSVQTAGNMQGVNDTGELSNVDHWQQYTFTTTTGNPPPIVNFSADDGVDCFGNINRPGCKN